VPAGPGGRYRRRGRAAAGIEALAPSAVAFDDIRSRWQAALGAGRPLAPEEDLRAMMPGDRFRLDVPSRIDVPSRLNVPSRFGAQPLVWQSFKNKFAISPSTAR
jgi:hypothetical protein